MKERKYYTILLGNDIWENCIDDMNSGAIWAMGGMLWKSYKKALACMKSLKNPAYGFETEDKKFSIKQLYFSPPRPLNK